jgi:hypothetical protein
VSSKGLGGTPVESLVTGGVRSLATCGPNSYWTAFRSRGSLISVAPCSIGQSSSPMTITDRLGNSTTEPTP